MTTTFELGDVIINVTCKNIKNSHLTVHPPDGRVTLSVPMNTRLDLARAYAISKLGWIRKQQTRFQQQARESQRQFIGRESHYLWGQRYLLNVVEQKSKPYVKLDHKYITLYVRPHSDYAKRAAVIHAWHKSLLHQFIAPQITKWEPVLDVKVNAYFLQRMKTRWGSCNHTAGNIRLNTELVKKPKDLVEYVIVHEMAHLIEPSHNQRFVAILDQYYPAWREAQAELNALPLSVGH